MELLKEHLKTYVSEDYKYQEKKYTKEGLTTEEEKKVASEDSDGLSEENLDDEVE